jgi:protein arginine N-methyltransferase 1
VDFAGSNGSPAQKRVVLSTGPEAGYTHWGQQVFYLRDCIECTPASIVKGDVEMTRQQQNKRLYNVFLTLSSSEGVAQTHKYEIL